MTNDEHLKLLERIRRLRAKANDPSVTLEEAKAFAAKAQELIHANQIDPKLLDATPPPPAPPPAANAHYDSGAVGVPNPTMSTHTGGRGLGKLELGLLVAIVVVAVGGAVVLLQPRGVGPAIANASPTAPATPAATPGPAVTVTRALWARIGRLGPSYHLSGSGTMKSDAVNQRFTVELDVVADDFAGRLNATGRDAVGKSRIVRYEGVVYVRRDGEKKWVHLTTNDPMVRQWPFMGIQEPREIAYAGEIELDGATHHRFETTRYYRPSIERMLGLNTFPASLNAVRLELIVDEEGIPVRAEFRVDGGGVDADGKARFVGKATYEFTQWDGDLTITVPN